MGMKSAGGGEIVQVQGGHIVRSTGRKDRHSKVYTAKGPRDRRVRLSAHTAIQFYDVQDRLGYDRPSKAVDWLIKKAKSAIDKLDELPPWHPSGTSAIDADLNAAGSSDIAAIEQQQQQQQQQSDSSGYGINIPRHMENNHPSDDNPFIPQSLDSDTIADTMKSFFPTTTANLSLNFQNYPHHMISNSANKSQDLCLSLHSFQDPSRDSGHHTNPTEHTLFAGSDTVGYEAHPGEWTDHQPSELNRFHRMMGWNGGGGGDGDNRGGGFVFNQPALTHHHHHQQLLGSSSQVNSEFSQRGTLQSSFSNSVRAWDDLPISSTDHHETHQPIHHHSSSISGNRFVSEGFSGFCIPARIHGEEDHGVVHDKRPSASPNPHR